jgi:hypothetical protein
VDRVHASVDRPGTLGPPWTDGSGDRGGGAGRGSALIGARPPAAPVHQSSPAGAQQGEERMRSSARASPGLGWRRGGWAMAVRNRRQRRSVRGRLERGEKRIEAGRGAVNSGGGARLL